jgi:hypothetical protein
MEARERLIHEMEESARHRVEAAEAEQFRLKGLLSHMEQVANGLRSQLGEEKQRLHYEQNRLHDLQVNHPCHLHNDGKI